MINSYCRVSLLRLATESELDNLENRPTQNQHLDDKSTHLLPPFPSLVSPSKRTPPLGLEEVWRHSASVILYYMKQLRFSRTT